MQLLSAPNVESSVTLPKTPMHESHRPTNLRKKMSISNPKYIASLSYYWQLQFFVITDDAPDDQRLVSKPYLGSGRVRIPMISDQWLVDDVLILSGFHKLELVETGGDGPHQPFSPMWCCQVPNHIIERPQVTRLTHNTMQCPNQQAENTPNDLK